MIKKTNKGFTLVELLVTLTIMAILTAIAWPQFSQQKAKAMRQDCIAGMSGAVQAMEEWHNTIGVYAAAGMNNYKAAVSNTNLQQCQQRGYQTGAAPFATCNNACRITVTTPDARANAPADSYLLTATRFYNAGTPVADRDSDCNSFTLNDLGTKGALNLAGAVSTATCWLSN